jgi:hypothetical protein
MISRFVCCRGVKRSPVRRCGFFGLQHLMWLVGCCFPMSSLSCKSDRVVIAGLTVNKGVSLHLTPQMDSPCCDPPPTSFFISIDYLPTLNSQHHISVPPTRKPSSIATQSTHNTHGLFASIAFQ